MATIISVMGRKGGVGKTTLAKNLAAGCARAGLITVLVDADGQGNATAGVRVVPYDGFKALIKDDAEWADVLHPIPVDYAGVTHNFFVLPAYNGQMAVEDDPQSVPQIVQRFAELTGQVDVVIVDTSPGTSYAHIGLYYALHYVLMPSLCVMESILSLGSMLDYLHSAEKSGVAAGYAVAKFLGIIPNQFDASEGVQKVNLGFIQGKYSETMTIFRPLRDLTVWRQASQYRMSIWQLADTGTYRERRDAKAAGNELDPVLKAIMAVVKQEKQTV
jgi:cellulose biosynthesis protein BcsQ